MTRVPALAVYILPDGGILHLSNYRKFDLLSDIRHNSSNKILEYIKKAVLANRIADTAPGMLAHPIAYSMNPVGSPWKVVGRFLVATSKINFDRNSIYYSVFQCNR